MLTTAEIKQFIDEDRMSDKKMRAGEGQRYYDGEHDILNCRFFYYDANGNIKEDKTRANIKIPHPFFTELSDQLPSYMLSFEDNPIQAKEKAEGLQEHLDGYFDEEFWGEISDLITGAYSKGFDYVYGYRNAENRLRIQYADSMGVVEVDAKYASDKQNHILYHYIDRFDKDKKPIIKIQDWTEADTTYYTQLDTSGRIELDDTVEINPRPHVIFKDEKTGKMSGLSLGYIPFWRLDNNRKQFSGLKPIKALIDDYDLMMCGLSNNLTDFDTPLHVVSGFQGDNLDELQQNLKTKKIIGVDEGGGVEVRTVDIPYQARQAKAEADEKAIYHFGMGLNTSGLKDTNATTNMGIQMLYSSLELKAGNLQKRLNKVLKNILKVVLDEINEEYGTDYQMSDIKLNFKRKAMVNETEQITAEKTKAEAQQIRVNTILNAAAEIGEEQVLKSICEQLDLNYEDIKEQVEKDKEPINTATAKTLLDGVEPEPEPEPIPDIIE